MKDRTRNRMTSCRLPAPNHREGAPSFPSRTEARKRRVATALSSRHTTLLVVLVVLLVAVLLSDVVVRADVEGEEGFEEAGVEEEEYQHTAAQHAPTLPEATQHPAPTQEDRKTAAAAHHHHCRAGKNRSSSRSSMILMT